jgi:hypothetical protein
MKLKHHDAPSSQMEGDNLEEKDNMTIPWSSSFCGICRKGFRSLLSVIHWLASLVTFPVKLMEGNPPQV